MHLKEPVNWFERPIPELKTSRAASWPVGTMNDAGGPLHDVEYQLMSGVRATLRSALCLNIVEGSIYW